MGDTSTAKVNTDNNSDCKTDDILENHILLENNEKCNKKSFGILNGNKSINCRDILWYMTFASFAVNYMIRVNLNITLVDMIVPQSTLKRNNNVVVSECYTRSGQEEYSTNSSIGDEFTKSRFFSIERKLLDLFSIDFDRNGFNWNEYEQGLVLGSFYWFYWSTQIPGGMLAQKFGTKLVFGLSNFLGSIVCLFIPMTAYLNFKSLLILRALQGIIAGVSWPAMGHLCGQWIPPNERSKFMSAFQGFSIGTAIFYPIFGYVIVWTSWEWVYYLCGIIGFAWYMAWLYLIYDSPAKHPRIDPVELAYIEQALGRSGKQLTKISTPWKHIFTSIPVWMNVLCQFGGIWALLTLMTQAPTYFKEILGWRIEAIGWLSGCPHLARAIFAIYFSMYCDYLLKNNKMSRTNVRNFAVFVCNILNGIFIIGLAFSGCNSIVAITFLILGNMVYGGISPGALANVVDLSPNFSGSVMGISGFIGVLPGFISPFIVGALTLGNQTVQQWQYIFLIAAAILIITGILYILYSDSEVQKWDHLNENDNAMEEETLTKQDGKIVENDNENSKCSI